MPPTFPETITGAWPAYRNSHPGPFAIGDNLYNFTITSTAVAAYKSTDHGDTWVEQDSANRPTADANTLQVVPSGSTLYVCYRVSGFIRVQKFTSDAWQALDSGMTTTPPGNNDRPHISGVGGVTHFALRGDGNYVVFHQQAPGMDMGSDLNRVDLHVFQSGAWTQIVFSQSGAVHFDSRAIARVNDETWCFFTKGGSNTLFVRRLTDANVLGAEETVVSGTSMSSATTQAYGFGLPVAWLDGVNTKCAIPYRRALNDFGESRATKAATPTWAEQTIRSGTQVEVSTSNPGALVADGTELWAVHVDASGDDLYISTDGGTAGWDAASLLQAATVQGVSANLIDNAGGKRIGVLFNDAGTVKYTEHALASGPTTHELAGSARSSTRATGALSRDLSLATAARSSTRVTGAVSVLRQLAANARSSTRVTGLLAMVVILDGVARSSTRATGAISVLRGMLAAARSTTRSTGALLIDIALNGAARSTSRATGALSVLRDLAAAARSSTRSSGAIDLMISFAGSARSSTRVSGALRAILAIAGSARSTTRAEAVIAVTRTLAGAARSTTRVAGDLLISGQVALEGAARSASRVTGALNLDHSLSAAARSTTRVTGDLLLAGQQALEGAARSSTRVAGSLGVTRALSAAARSATRVTGAIVYVVGLSGGARSSTRVTGDLSITTAAVELAGSARSTTRSSAALAVDRSLSGEARSETRSTGTITVSITLAGEARSDTRVTGELTFLAEIIEITTPGVDGHAVILAPLGGRSQIAANVDGRAAIAVGVDGQSTITTGGS